MTQNDNILKELTELGSSLAKVTPQNIYTVPAGYFEGLADVMLNRIKALEANDTSDALSYLSPVLNTFSKQMPYNVPSGYFEGLADMILNRVKTLNLNNASGEFEYVSPVLNNVSKQMPYSVPSGYFEGLENKLMQVIRESSDYQTPKEELESISPLLSGLKKQIPYSVPNGYFDNLHQEAKVNKSAAKIVSIGSRKWFRYAAAAVVTGIIAVSSFIYFNRNSVDPNKNPDGWVAKNMKKVSADKIDEFIKLADDETSLKESVASSNTDRLDEVKELVKDIPEKEIQDFLNETEVLNESDNDIFLN